MEVPRVIVRIENARAVYKNMNKELIDSYKRQGIVLVPTLGEHTRNFEQEYNVRVIIENSAWAAFEFPSEHDATLAIIKWS